MLDVLPWHRSQWHQLCKSLTHGRLPHALLLTGPEGIGLKEFAILVASRLLCLENETTSAPCGKCRSCVLFEAGNHPDYMLVDVEEDGKQIRVEQIRKMIDFINLKSQFDRLKIVIIDSAHSMNKSAANSLLKTLEEPPPDSLILLTTHRPNLLPVTIRSRCQKMIFQPDYSTETLEWLKHKIAEPASAETLLRFAGGAPFAAANYSDEQHLELISGLINDLYSVSRNQINPVALSQKWNKAGAEYILYWLLRLFTDILRLKIKTSPILFYQGDSLEILQGLTNQLDLVQLMQSYDLLLKNYGLASSQISFNTQGLLEDFIIYWQETSNCEGKP